MPGLRARHFAVFARLTLWVWETSGVWASSDPGWSIEFAPESLETLRLCGWHCSWLWLHGLHSTADGIARVHEDADYVCSLVTNGLRGRPTDYNGDHTEPSGTCSTEQCQGSRTQPPSSDNTVLGETGRAVRNGEITYLRSCSPRLRS